jgi:hypothetical protein
LFYDAAGQPGASLGPEMTTHQVNLRQAEGILERFPGPVTLRVSRRRRLVGLAFSLAVTVIFAWIWIVDPGPQYRWYDWIMLPVVVLLFGGLTIRAVILLLFPDSASLTLDAHGFEIGQVFRRIRVPWRGVSGFRVETTNWRFRIGGSLRQITYDALDTGTERRGSTQISRVLPEIYGLPRLRGDEFAWLMNEWRQRALATSPAKTSVPIVPPAD